MGVFLHDVMEHVPFESLRGGVRLEDWGTRTEIEILFTQSMRRYGIDPVHIDAARALVYSTLTVPIPLGERGVLTQFADLDRIVREMEFLYPIPERQEGAVDRGYVKGFVDFVFEHEGLVYFADWKSDILTNWERSSVRKHVVDNYETQAMLYSVALTKALGVSAKEAYEERFGGLLYCFMRGMAANEEGAVVFQRPAFEQIERWIELMRSRRLLSDWVEKRGSDAH